MLKRTILLTSALVGVELIAGGLAAQAGGMSGFHMPHSVNVGAVSSRLGPLNCKTGSGHPGLNVTTGITNNIDRSSNISANVNIDNSKYIDTSTNITVNKDINVRTTNIFNGMGSGSDHSQGGSWGSHTGNMGGGMGCGSMCGGGNNGGSSSNQNNNGNSNSNGNSNGNTNNVDNSSSNTVNNSNSIDASGAINAFFNGLRGFQ